MAQLQIDRINAEDEFHSLEARIKYAEASGVYSTRELRAMYYDSEQLQHRITWMSRFIASEQVAKDRGAAPV